MIDERLDPTKADGALIPMKQEPAPALDLGAIRKMLARWRSPLLNAYVSGENAIAAVDALLLEVERLTAEREQYKAECNAGWQRVVDLLRRDRDEARDLALLIASWLGNGPGGGEWTTRSDMETRIKQGVDDHVRVSNADLRRRMENAHG